MIATEAEIEERRSLVAMALAEVAPGANFSVTPAADSPTGLTIAWSSSSPHGLLIRKATRLSRLHLEGPDATGVCDKHVRGLSYRDCATLPIAWALLGYCCDGTRPNTIT